MMKHLRLVKVILQPVFVIDDGETLEEVTGQAATIPAKDLDGFVGKFRDDMVLAERQLNEQAEEPVS